MSQLISNRAWYKGQAVLTIKAKTSHFDRIGYYTKKSSIGHIPASCQSPGGTGQQVTTSSMFSCFSTTNSEGISLDYTRMPMETPLPVVLPPPVCPSLKVTGSRAGSGSSVTSPAFPAAAYSLSVWVVSTEGGCLIYFGSMSLRNVPI